MNFRSLLCISALLTSTSVLAHDYRIGDLYIGQPYARPSVAGQSNGAAYFSIENKSSRADTFVSADSPAAGSVEIHSMSMDGGVMRMREVGGIDLKPGAKVTMQPGNGYHLMMVDLKAPLKTGDKLPLTLHFKNAGKLEVSLSVEDHASRNGSVSSVSSAHKH